MSVHSQTLFIIPTNTGCFEHVSLPQAQQMIVNKVFQNNRKQYSPLQQMHMELIFVVRLIWGFFATRLNTSKGVTLVT